MRIDKSMTKIIQQTKCDKTMKQKPRQCQFYLNQQKIDITAQVNCINGQDIIGASINSQLCVCTFIISHDQMSGLFPIKRLGNKRITSMM